MEWCVEDSRAEMYCENAISCIKSRFSDEADDKEEYEGGPFDVLIMDALDPQDDIPFARILYTLVRSSFESLYDLFSDDGVMVFELGVALYLADPNMLTM